MTCGACGADRPMAKIAPGSSRVGCIAFDVPSGVRPKTFQFTLNSGFGDQTGEWRMSGARSTANATRPSELSAYSPASARRYVTACAAGTQIECTTADGALIRFARSAVDAYSQGQADAYAASHDTGP